MVQQKVLMRCANVLMWELKGTDDGRRTTTTDDMANGRQQEILIFYLDEVCSLFILVLVVQIVRTKKPRKDSINIEAK